jgi:hypothetical protein
MNILAIALLLLAGGNAAAGETAQAQAQAATPTATTPAKSKTDALVEASRAAKSKRRKSTSKVITNADVKKSKGKIVETKLAPLPETAPSAGMVEIHEATKKASAEERARIESAAAKVADLEEELAAIEQQYYEENDLDRRDREIVARFNDARRRLDDARRQLAAYSSAVDKPASD